jgi:RNA polymerase sigma-70 factor, ECF subfamily
MSNQLEPIYQEFDAKLRHFILSRIANPQDAEDILQEIYLRIHAHIGSLRQNEKLQPWIYQIARNATIDFYRRQHITVELTDELPLLAEQAGDEASAARELAESLGEMIHCLPEKYQEPLKLVELQGLTQQAVANQLGLTLSAAKSRVQRAREKLKEALLDCCHFEFDRMGHVLQYEPKCNHCAEDGLPGHCAQERGSRK